jgi:hypothetical protein
MAETGYGLRTTISSCLKRVICRRELEEFYWFLTLAAMPLQLDLSIGFRSSLYCFLKPYDGNSPAFLRRRPEWAGKKWRRFLFHVKPS